MKELLGISSYGEVKCFGGRGIWESLIGVVAFLVAIAVADAVAAAIGSVTVTSIFSFESCKRLEFRCWFSEFNVLWLLINCWVDLEEEVDVNDFEEERKPFFIPLNIGLGFFDTFLFNEDWFEVVEVRGVVDVFEINLLGRNPDFIPEKNLDSSDFLFSDADVKDVVVDFVDASSIARRVGPEDLRTSCEIGTAIIPFDTIGSLVLHKVLFLCYYLHFQSVFNWIWSFIAAGN